MPQYKISRCTLFFLVICLYQPLISQVGVGVTGAYQYPGLLSSDKYDIRFNAGLGYGFYAKHDILKFEEGIVYLRYLARISKHRAELPGAISASTVAEYEFSNLSLDILYEFFVKNDNKYYTGLSLNLLRTLSEGKFRANYTGNAVYPSLCLGWERTLTEGFDVFGEVLFGYGRTDADGGPEEIPVTGFSLLLGITMYVSE